MDFQQLDLRLGRLQLARDDFRLKSHGAMRAVAKRFVVALPTTAERDRCSSRQIKLIPSLIKNFELAFEANVAVVVDGDFRGHEAISGDVFYSYPGPVSS